jgi:hypothetical protein
MEPDYALPREIANGNVAGVLGDGLPSGRAGARASRLQKKDGRKTGLLATRKMM